MKRLALGALAALVMAPGATAAPTSTEMTDHRTYAHWAHPVMRAAVRTLPRASSPRIDRLHWSTEDGHPEVYAVHRTATDPRGRIWFRVTVPGRPRGTVGWVPSVALGPRYRVTTRLEVDRTKLDATLFRNGRRIWHARVGIGAPGMETPRGTFVIREKFRNPNPNGSYGPMSLGTSAYSRLSDWPGGGVVGLHGTDQPGLIPGRPSHGCVRIQNHSLRTLYALASIGTPIEIY